MPSEVNLNFRSSEDDSDAFYGHNYILACMTTIWPLSVCIGCILP